jgi:hypothetical protein
MHHPYSGTVSGFTWHAACCLTRGWSRYARYFRPRSGPGPFPTRRCAPGRPAAYVSGWGRPHRPPVPTIHKLGLASTRRIYGIPI